MDGRREVRTESSLSVEPSQQALEEVLRRRELQQALRNGGKVELDVDPERLRKLREEG